MYLVKRPSRPWFLVDRAGRASLLVGDSRTYRYPRFSADSGQFAVTIARERADIYVVDVQRRTLRRLTRTGSNTHPIWTLDGQHVTFASRRPGSDAYDIYWVPADESGEVELLMTRKDSQFPSGWSPDGQILAFYEINNDTARDVWTVSMDGLRTTEFVRTVSNERVPTFSPDGNWLAYCLRRVGTRRDLREALPGPRCQGGHLEREAGVAVSSQSPTLTKGTALGAILGTAGYMSPEQAGGKTVDRRTDVWAFGCCLFEAVSRRSAFQGDTVAETLANIIAREPTFRTAQPQRLFEGSYVVGYYASDP